MQELHEGRDGAALHDLVVHGRVARQVGEDAARVLLR